MQLPFSICWAWQLYWFGLLGFSFMRSGLTVRSWSRLSGGFCLCSSVGARTVLVRSVLIYLGRPDLVCSVLLCSFSLHWFGRGCSVPGRCVLVELILVLFALFCSGVVQSASL